MKVLLYTEGLKTIGKSGLGKAIKHQMKALEDEKIEYTTNPKDDYDILHINTYFLKSYFLAKKAKRMGKKIVYHAHSTEEDFKDGFIFCRQISPLFKKWIMKCYSLGDVIVTPTPYSKKLLDGYGMNRKIYAISNGIDLDLFKKDKKSGELFRKTYGYKKTDKVIIGIGLYIERKGIVDFVELAKRMPEYKFIWFGHSPLSAATKKVRDAVNTKLDNLVFAGYVEQNMIKAALNGCDLYLFPTLEETEGIPIIEACAVGADAIIRDIPIFDDWLIDGENVYKAKDVDEFELKIKKFFNGELKSVSDKAHKVAEDRDLNKIGKQLKKVYQTVLKMPTKKTVKNNINYLKTLSIFLASILFIIGSFLISNKYRIETKEYTRVINCFDTNITITVNTLTKNKADKVLDGVEEIYQKYYKLTDRNNNKSELSFIYNNTSKETNLTLSNELYDILEYSNKNGLVNIYNGALIELYKNNNTPNINTLLEAKKNIIPIKLLGNNKIENNHANIYLDDIIKGYTNRIVMEYLKDNKIDQYIINVKNNILIGKKKDSKYKVALTSPFDGELIEVLNITDTNISTKNNDSNIIDLNTLEQINDIVSITVISNDPIYADLMSTKLFLMDLDNLEKTVNEDSKIEAIWCFYESNTGTCIKSNNFNKYE